MKKLFDICVFDAHDRNKTRINLGSEIFYLFSAYS